MSEIISPLDFEYELHKLLEKYNALLEVTGRSLGYTGEVYLSLEVNFGHETRTLTDGSKDKLIYGSIES